MQGGIQNFETNPTELKSTTEKPKNHEQKIDIEILLSLHKMVRILDTACTSSYI